MMASMERNAPPIAPLANGIGNSTFLKAKKIFFDSLPFPWVLLENRSIQDNHYDIEIFEPDKSLGVAISVSIKGTTNLQINHDWIKLSLPVDQLIGFYDEMEKPLLLSLVDVEKEQVFWLLTQHYVHNILDVSSPGWRNKKTVTLKIPFDQQLSTSGPLLWTHLLETLELTYFRNFHTPYREISSRIQNYTNSPGQMELALKREMEKQYKKQIRQKSECSVEGCHSCSEDEMDDTLSFHADNLIQKSLEHAQQLKLLDPKENRTAFYCIREALDHSGRHATLGVRHTAIGEMSFYDYLLYFMKVFDTGRLQSIDCLIRPEEHLRYFKALRELTTAISSALDDGEIFATSMLMIRLADTYLFAIPYISKTFGQEQASPLLDYAQTLLVLAHELASLVEAPGRILQ
ncbi:DUF4365 domain-containing protein [Desulforamulus ruminis]|uniref:DUF4365 domain-containing protein n=1 Tax=Desulforamulus ruminis (strain ATCC 23193 / DSM 2154 / NCIMB 8452 / DL) TaxID=696281 RepID=F6DPY3_DESRL|nr:DUF4365 domain-containing protein [Desulforamulus ruminis]AEG60822.1 hypothetical protein Desru_2595 [Desulforamulus ruminis DSM 2154]